MENKTADEILRDLIDKHLEFKSGLETTLIQYYAEYGKVSGSMYLNVKRLYEEYASIKLAEKDKETEELMEKAEKLSDVCYKLINRFNGTDSENPVDLYMDLVDARDELSESLNK